MKVKAVEIARGLGLSKATVSLALNHKPGVSEEKRREIFAYKEQLEALAEESGARSGRTSLRLPNVIMVVMASKEKQVAINSELDLWTDVLAAFQSTAKAAGYETRVIYVDALRDDLGSVIAECGSERVAGVLLAATELDDDDFTCFASISKPVVVYDNWAAKAELTSVVLNSAQGVQAAVRYLLDRELRDIVYLANSESVYNFQKRREGFLLEMAKGNAGAALSDRIVAVGRTIDEVDANMTAYLDARPLPQAFITENYQVTIGVTRALRRKGVRLPEDVSLIGVDKLPSYMTGDLTITCVRVPQAERAVLAMQALLGKISFAKAGGRQPLSCAIAVDCSLEEGDSVRDKTT